MFCSNCGEKVDAGATECPACKTRLESADNPTVAAARAELRQGSRDAGDFLKNLVRKPGVGVADGVRDMDARRATVSGAILAVAIALVAAIGAAELTRSTFGVRLAGISFWKAFLLCLSPTLALAVLRTATRKLFGKAGNFGQDLLASAGVLIPVALAMLLTRLFGTGNLEVSFILLVAAQVFFIVGLHETARSVAGIHEKAAPAVITAEILFAAWIVKVVGVALW